MQIPRIERQTIIALISSLLIIQGAVVILQEKANDVIARNSTYNDLEESASVYRRLMAERSQELERATTVLSRDFGLRSAFAFADRSTAESILINHGTRIGADFAALLDAKQEVMATVPFSKLPVIWPPLHKFAEGAIRNSASALGLVEGELFQLIAAPVLAPELLGWIVIGARIDDAIAVDLRTVTGADVTFQIRLQDRIWRTQASSGGDADSLQDDRVLAGTILSTTVFEKRFGAGASVKVELSRLIAESAAPFEQLERTTRFLTFIAIGLYVLGIIVITHRLVKPLNRMAYEDALTGLGNRSLLNIHLDECSEAANYGGEGCGIVLLDLDRFKTVNDQLGHAVGDELLREVARRLVGAVRDSDLVVRQGGDEFVIILKGVEPKNIEVVISKIVASLEVPWVHNNQPIDMSASVGVALMPYDASDGRDAMRYADAAMYESKRSKRSWCRWTEQISNAPISEVSMLGQLREAMRAGHLELHYQPQIRLTDGSVVGAESLVRWRHPGRGLVPPAEFIPFAESTGFMRSLTDWIIERAVRDCATWQDRGYSLRVAVNVTPDDLQDKQLPERILGWLRAAKMPPERLCLEVTETDFIKTTSKVIEVMEELRQLGINLAVDDFGTGYASLDYLRRLPVSEIKIDQSFVVGMNDKTSDHAIVLAALDLGQRLGLKVVAEGVEDQSTMDALSSAGCNLAQGFHIARPAPIDRFLNWLEYRKVDRAA